MSSILLYPASFTSVPGGDFGWVRTGGDGETLIDHGGAPLALLPTAREAELMVPGFALSWHSVTLPQGSLGNAGRLRTVLEGLLEEQLLDEPEKLHFALQPGAKTGTPVWVAACDRAALRATVQAIEDSGRRVTRIVPEFAPPAEGEPATVYVTGEAQAGWLTVCDANGVATLPLAASGPGLALARNTQLDTAMLGAEPAVAALAEEMLGQRVPIVPHTRRWLHAARGPWDLAQFEFASSARARAGKKLAALAQTLRHAPQWRAARWGVAVFVLVQIAGLNVWAWKERAALDARRNAINGVLTQTFPSVKLVVDAPAQMAREIAVLRQASGEMAAGDFEPMLGTLAAGLPAGRVPAAIDFSGAQLRLRGLGLSQQELDALRNSLAPQGYSARGEGDLLLVQAEAAP